MMSASPVSPISRNSSVNLPATQPHHVSSTPSASATHAAPNSQTAVNTPLSQTAGPSTAVMHPSSTNSIQTPAGPTLSTSSNNAPTTAPNANASPPTQPSGPKLATWGISWVQPTWMLIFLLCGILLAVGHHLYYASLNGTTAGSASRQQWPIRFGTAFAYLTTSCLNAAVGIAFTQRLWSSVRRKAYSIDSIDKMFAITTDPTSFWSWEVVSRANIVSLLAIVVWLVPFAAIVPPATLTVGTASQPQVHEMAIGIPNWDSLYLVTPGFDDIAPVPSNALLKIALQSGERSAILPMQAPAVNSSYDVPFFGPTVQCKIPNEAQQAAFDHYAARIQNESNIYVISDTGDVAESPPGAPLLELLYSAFSPRLSELFDDSSVDITYNNWKPELGLFTPTDPLRPGVLQDAVLQELWVKLADESIVCQLANASYSVHVDNLNGAQSVSVNSIQALPAYNQTYLENCDADCSGWDTEAQCLHIKLQTPEREAASQENYIAWFGALSSLLNGNITLDSTLGMFNVTTKLVQQTGLTSCPEIPNNAWIQYCQSGQDKDFCTGLGDTTTLDFPPVDPYLCRNGSLARAIEDLGNNLTISLLSSQQLPWGSTVDEINQAGSQNQGVVIPVTIVKQVNVYVYDWHSLIISYFTAVGVVFAVVILGGYTFMQNGVSHVTSFSAIVATTRNTELDALAEGQCLGAVPLPEDVGKTRLRFGVVGPLNEKIRHAAFGLEKSVQTLELGTSCS